MDINILQYVNEGEIKEAILDAIKEQTKEQYLRNTENYISNIGYKMVENMCNDIVPTFSEELKFNIIKVIKGLTGYTVFNHDSWGKPYSEGLKILNDILKELQPEIKTKVKSLIENMDDYVALEVLKGMIADSKFFKGDTK